MAAPYVVSAVFVLAVVAFCFLKPNGGRLFLGFFYLAMALGVNGAFVLTSPDSYTGYVAGSYWPFYRDVALWLINLLTPVVFGLLLAAFEIAVAVLLLSRGRNAKIGLCAVIVFIIGIAPISTMQLPWLGFAVAAGYLLRKDYPRSIMEMLAGRRTSMRATN